MVLEKHLHNPRFKSATQRQLTCNLMEKGNKIQNQQPLPRKDQPIPNFQIQSETPDPRESTVPLFKKELHEQTKPN